MKKILFLLVIALMSLETMAQKPLSYSEVINAEGKSAKELYKEVKRWFSLTFVSAQDVIQYDDASNEIIGKAVFEYECKSLTWSASSGIVRYVVSVKMKDGRVKMTIENFIHESTDPTWGKGWSNGIVYEKPLSDDEMKTIGMGGLKKRQYRAIDERVRPLVLNQIATLLVSLKQHLANIDKKKSEEDDW